MLGQEATFLIFIQPNVSQLSQLSIATTSSMKHMATHPATQANKQMLQTNQQTMQLMMALPLKVSGRDHSKKTISTWRSTSMWCAKCQFCNKIDKLTNYTKVAWNPSEKCYQDCSSCLDRISTKSLVTAIVGQNLCDSNCATSIRERPVMWHKSVWQENARKARLGATGGSQWHLLAPVPLLSTQFQKFTLMAQLTNTREQLTAAGRRVGFTAF